VCRNDLLEPVEGSVEGGRYKNSWISGMIIVEIVSCRIGRNRNNKI
jgi:hypothetical protein